MSKWFKKVKEGIKYPTRLILGTQQEVINKCPACQKTMNDHEIESNFYICKCGFHYRISPYEYFNILFDENQYDELFTTIEVLDKLDFHDRLSYMERIQTTGEKTGSKDAVVIANGKVDGMETIIAAMDFSFIGGSTGSVEGEKIARAIDFAREKRIPFLMITKSGGVRIMESLFSLMQMAKIIAKISQLHEDKLPYFSLMTDPTIAGVSSFAMLADIVMAEPDALIGYTAPKTITESMGKELPKDFQRSEFLLENGFIDFIIRRNELKEKYSRLLHMLNPS